MSDYSDKLKSLCSVLKQNSLDAYIIPVSDPHLGENIPDHWKIIRWLTGFTGSSGTVVITDSFAGLWTDSRYLLQAEKELAGSGFTLMKSDSLVQNDHLTWLTDNVLQGWKIGIDGRLFPMAQLRKMEKLLSDKEVVFLTEIDLVNDAWTDRPALPAAAGWDFPVKYAGKDRSAKIAEVRKLMKDRSVDHYLITAIDDIMWLLNIRGADAEFSPLLASWAIVGHEQVLLFVDESKMPYDLALALDKCGVMTLPYDEVAGMLETLPQGSSVLVSPDSVSAALYRAIPERCRVVESPGIIPILKAVKNKVEIENLEKVMVKDGVALTRFFFHVESGLGSVPMTEVSLAGKIMEYRKMQDGFLGPSFVSITAFNEHAALPHYCPAPGTDSIIDGNGLLLVDSGGQYMGGTTDVTRTIHTGTPSPGQKKDFTIVLKGHINMASVKFPQGTKGYQIDVLARKALWDNGINYGHGTGHGIGYCLNVHEGPHSISPALNKTELEAGMIVSNEPAVYRPGKYGIRTENMMICYEDEETEFGNFLKFDTISLCYIDKVLIDRSLLNKEEIQWINSYHAEVYQKLGPHLDPDERSWLKEKTDPL